MQLRVELLDVTPQVLRRLIVPHDIRLSDLHTVLQLALGWENAHLYEFRINGVGYGVPDADDPGESTVDAAGTPLMEATRRRTRAFEYLYDFGDGWQHVITGRIRPVRCVCSMHSIAYRPKMSAAPSAMRRFWRPWRTPRIPNTRPCGNGLARILTRRQSPSSGSARALLVLRSE